MNCGAAVPFVPESGYHYLAQIPLRTAAPTTTEERRGRPPSGARGRATKSEQAGHYAFSRLGARRGCTTSGIESAPNNAVDVGPGNPDALETPVEPKNTVEVSGLDRSGSRVGFGSDRISRFSVSLETRAVGLLEVTNPG